MPHPVQHEGYGGQIMSHFAPPNFSFWLVFYEIFCYIVLTNRMKILNFGKKSWSHTLVLLGLVTLLVHFSGFDGAPYTFVALVALIANVFASVHHADGVAHYIGEPLGSIVLAIAVTIIEVGLIVSLMFVDGVGPSALARDTVFSGVMILINGVVGACLFVGSLKYGEQSFSVYGIGSALSTLAAILILTLVFPNYTLTTPGPTYSTGQLTFIALVSTILYGTFLLVQNVRHRNYFVVDGEDEKNHNRQPLKVFLTSLVFLSLSLLVVVIVGKSLSPDIKHVVYKLNLPQSLVGVVIAMITLLPETISALKAGAKNHIQKSLNLATGSALASIGLSIPVVALISLSKGTPLVLGLDPKESVLLLLSIFVASLSLGHGKTTILQGVVHLVIFAVYLFMTAFPSDRQKSW